ncbi:BgTH12-03373 [Blumeria graminis f. sp. triticale]|nr:BgTH12-03373 [Blumeria graminis f. sp. triticale]
MISTKN